jgi:hypothetical protein
MQSKNVYIVNLIRVGRQTKGASLLDDFAPLPLLHTLVEERVGERRLLVRWEVHGKRFDHLNPVQAKSELVNGAESCHIALRPARLSQRAGAGRGGKYEL